MNNQTEAFVSSRPWTWKDKLRTRLFPSKYCEAPDSIRSGEYMDVLVCKVTARLSMIDRLRVLISGRFVVESKTITQNIIGATLSHSEFYALPPLWWDTKER